MKVDIEKAFDHMKSVFCKSKDQKPEDQNHIKPLVFPNLPIEDEKNDVIGLNSIIETIDAATKSGAQMIGIVGDYGSGKTSLIKMLGGVKHYKKIITINLWDSISREKGNTDISVNDLVKAFIYQMSVGTSRGTAHYVNRRLSKNFGIMSFGVNSAWFWPWSILGAFLLILGRLASVMNIADLLKAFESLFAFEEEWLEGVLTLIKQGSVLISGLGICLLTIGFCKTTVAFSKGMKECHEPEANDVFECYSLVYRKNCKVLGRRRHIVIEDLDRIPDKQLVMDFLKEVYRFCNQEFYWKRKKPIFLISVMPESHLKTVKSANTDQADKRDPALETDTEEQTINPVYSKVFDYIVNLRPIHYQDYANVLLDLTNFNSPTGRDRMCEVFGDDFEDTFSDSFYWLMQGHNLTLRELKIRLNSAISLYINIKNKNYKNETEISFASCAAVTYLEQQYPSLFTSLLSCAEELDNIVEKAYCIGSGKKSNDELDKLFERKPFCNVPESKAMKHDMALMLDRMEINSDYRLYFYSYSKNTYVKNDLELMIINMIRYPTSNPYDHDQHYEKISKRIDRILENPHSAWYLEIQKAIEERKNNCPSIVFYQEKLFELAASMEDGKFRLAYSLHHLQMNSLNPDAEKYRILKHVVQYGLDEYYIVWRFFAAVNVRKDKGELDRIEKSLKNGKKPILSEDELKEFPLRTAAIQMLDPSQINAENAEYIMDYLYDGQIDESIRSNVRKLLKAIRKVTDQNFFKEKMEPFIKKHKL